MEIKHPSLIKRVQSILIDTIIMVALMFLAAWVLEKFNVGDDEESGLIKAIIFICIWGIYEPLSMTLGSTIGNYLVGIKVRKHSSYNSRINIFQAYIRFVVKVLLGWISFITIGMNAERRAVHDFVSGSVMIEKK
ncbi:MAG: RDD family protein [Ferruginibacter sp.]|nr:RDD family protein [Ferruginibacter sp.]